VTAADLPRLRLHGRTALVTGAAGGIGQAVSRRLADEGATVICADLNEVAVRESARNLGNSSVGIALDVADETGVRGVIELAERLGGLDVLCNVAGIAGPQVPAEHTAVEDWDLTFAVNTRGPFLLCKHAARQLRRKRGNIINVASALALIGWRSESAYGPSKAGLVQFTKSAALDLAPDIRVNAVLPGAVRTPMITSILEGSADQEATLAAYGAIHPYGSKLLQPSAIADAVIFLASDDASFITGACVPVDAGLLATGRSAAERHGNGEHALEVP